MLIKLLNSTWTPKNVIPWENLIPTKIPSFPSFFIKTGIYCWPNNFPQYIQCPKIPFMELPLVKFQIYPISPSVHHHSPNDSRFISSQWSLSLWGSWALRHGFIWYNMWLFLIMSESESDSLWLCQKVKVGCSTLWHFLCFASRSIGGCHNIKVN